MSDWVGWHEERYADAGSALSHRLRTVQGLIRRFLDERPGEVRVLSLCAGDGRDLLGVLSERDDGRRVQARLVELDDRLADTARDTAAAARLTGIEVVQMDAGSTDAGTGAVPADLVLACGIFGNVSDRDVERTVRALPMLVAAGGAVIWTRGRRAPDLTPAIRRWFAAAGFAQRAFESPGGPDSWAVGMHELRGAPAAFRSGTKLFTFVARSACPSSSG